MRSDLVYKTNASVYNYSIICRESMSYFTGAHEHSAVDGLPTTTKSQADEGALHSSLKLWAQLFDSNHQKMVAVWPATLCVLRTKTKVTLPSLPVFNTAFSDPKHTRD